ncbi:conserved hypothetical protein [Trichinella spiralis]|uniref:hypothetical protein n=1 Tax=Trichinella spiralis TaxID=6334 RepID=UPI0001EFBFE6|nr:conserved hypothetical protein [Trichinella spiralis]
MCQFCLGHLDLNAPADCGDQEIPGSSSKMSMPKSLVPLTRLYNSAMGTNYFSIKQEEIRNLTTMGYRDLGVIGRIANDSKDPECKHLVPIYHIYSPIFRSDYYMTDPLLRNIRLAEGYHDKGILGYTAKGLGVCNSDVPIYEFFKREQGLMQMPNSTEVALAFPFGKLPDKHLSESALFNPGVCVALRANYFGFEE